MSIAYPSAVYSGHLNVVCQRILVESVKQRKSANPLCGLSPPFAAKYFSDILACAAGEGLIALWHLVKGVDAERWIEQADRAATSLP